MKSDNRANTWVWRTPEKPNEKDGHLNRMHVVSVYPQP